MTRRPKKNSLKKIYEQFALIFKEYWKIFLEIIAAATFFYLLYDRYKPKKIKYDDEKTIQGDIHSPKISNEAQLESVPQFYDNPYANNNLIARGIYVNNLSKREVLKIVIGHLEVDIPILDLYKGINLWTYAFGFCGNDGALWLIAREDRLYASAKFMDLQGGFKIGEIEYNHWKLFDGKYLDYFCDNENFEVQDHQGYIPFTMSFSENAKSAFVLISGYIISPTNVLVLNGDNMSCIPKLRKNWKEEAEIEINKIKSVVKTRNCF